MDRDVCLIVNPSAGAGRAARLLPAVEAALRGLGPALPRRADALGRARARAGPRRARRRARSRRRWAATGSRARSRASCATATACSPCSPAGAGTTSRASSGIGGIPVAACELLRGGRERRIDLAEAGGRCYLGILSAGLDSDVQVIANSTRAEARPAGLPLRDAAGARVVEAGPLVGHRRRRDDRLLRVLRGGGQLGRVRRRDVPGARRGARRRDPRRRADRRGVARGLPERACRRPSRARTCTSST